MHTEEVLGADIMQPARAFLLSAALTLEARKQFSQCFKNPPYPINFCAYHCDNLLAGMAKFDFVRSLRVVLVVLVIIGVDEPGLQLHQSTRT